MRRLLVVPGLLAGLVLRVRGWSWGGGGFGGLRRWLPLLAPLDPPVVVALLRDAALQRRGSRSGGGRRGGGGRS